MLEVQTTDKRCPPFDVHIGYPHVQDAYPIILTSVLAFRYPLKQFDNGGVVCLNTVLACQRQYFSIRYSKESKGFSVLFIYYFYFCRNTLFGRGGCRNFGGKFNGNIKF